METLVAEALSACSHVSVAAIPAAVQNHWQTTDAEGSVALLWCLHGVSAVVMAAAKLTGLCAVLPLPLPLSFRRVLRHDDESTDLLCVSR